MFSKGDIVATRTGTQYRVASVDGEHGNGRTIKAFRLSNNLVTYFRPESLTLVTPAR